MRAWKQRFRFWTQGLSPLALLTGLALVAGLLILYACQDTSEITQPSSLTAATTHKLTIAAAGNGSGTVTSTPSGINCHVTLGAKGPTGCAFSFGVTVTLKAVPAAGHAFAGWSSNVSTCTGTTTCKVAMGVDRTVTARFNKGPFVIQFSSASGGGSGKAKIQVGTTVKTCTISNGVPGPTGCGGSYAANSTVTLTATANAGFAFKGWQILGCGTGNCQFKAIDNLTTPVTFSTVTSGSVAVQGKWDPPVTTPVVAVHMHQLPTGKVLLWGDTGEGYLWSAATGFTQVPPKPFRIYCSGHAFLPDSRLLIVGGTDSRTGGLRLATLFNPATSSWSTSPSMAQGRYYPTLTTLANGSILAMSGQDTNLATVKVPEVRTPTGWRKLGTASLAVGKPFYPPMFVAPNGKVFLAGFTQPSQYLDANGTGSWTPVDAMDTPDRVMGSAVMYAPGKILYAGGGKGAPAYDGTPTATAELIDLNEGAPSWKPAGSMSFARRQLNTTILADGSVLVTGGTGGPGFNDQAGAVHAAELWNPETKEWKLMASEMKNRTYHSAALLLPSGQVLSGGGGEGGGILYANAEFSLQVFSPPYLFNPDGSPAPRPSITSAPASLIYGQSFTVETPDAASIVRGTLIRLSSVTHTFNQSQLLNSLSFSVSGPTTLSAAAPASGNVAPPGPYMLFLINESGVPSTAKFVKIGP
jgi:hypothetical protein